MLKKRFTFLCTDDERKLLIAISKRLKRSQGDTIRQLILAAANEFDVDVQSVEELVSLQHDGIEENINK